MIRFSKILIILVIAITLGACSIKSADNGTASTNNGDPVGIDNPFDNGGGEDDDDVIVAEGGSSGGSVSPQPTLSTPEYDPLEIVTTELEDCYQHTNYYQKLKGKGGSGDYEWMVTGLPDGIDGGKYLSGTTTANPGPYEIIVTLKDTETGESVTKILNLKVIEFIKEDLWISVAEFADKKWEPLNDNNADVQLATLDVEKRRLKLMVFKDDGTQIHSTPSAGRFHWSVTSTDDRLSVFVPPAGDADDKQGKVAYLMPWGTKNDLEFKILGIINSGNGLEDTEITVRDDFGNEAKLKIGKIDVEETIFNKCLSPHEELKADIPSQILYGVDRLHGKEVEVNGETVIRDDVALTGVSASGGVPPYSWKIGNVIGDENAYYPQHVVGNVSAETTVGCIPYQGAPCSQAQIHWGNIVLNVADHNNLTVKLPVQVTDACGNSIYKETELKVLWPHDPVNEIEEEGGLYVKVEMYEACHTNANTELHFKFFGHAGGRMLAVVRYELDPVPCDEAPRWYDTNGKWWHYGHPDMGGTVYITSADYDEDSQVGFRDMNHIEAHTTDTGGTPLDLEFIQVYFYSPHWVNFWYDGSDGIIGEEVGAIGVVVSDYHDGWKPRWDVVPPGRRTF